MRGNDVSRGQIKRSNDIVCVTVALIPPTAPSSPLPVIPDKAHCAADPGSNVQPRPASTWIPHQVRDDRWRRGVKELVGGDGVRELTTAPRIRSHVARTETCSTASSISGRSDRLRQAGSAGKCPFQGLRNFEHGDVGAAGADDLEAEGHAFFVLATGQADDGIASCR